MSSKQRLPLRLLASSSLKDNIESDALHRLTPDHRPFPGKPESDGNFPEVPPDGLIVKANTGTST